MQIDILTLHPDLLQSPFNCSIVNRAKEKGLVQINLHNLHDFSPNKWRKADDYPFGGGAGMVMMIEPIDKCLTELKKQRGYDELIYLSPDGELFDQKLANELSLKRNLCFICGHYKGVDERVRQHLITREISIGDYVLTGGELAAAVVVDSIVRLIPGAISDETSALTDSFQDGLVSPPVYTRPAEYNGWKVPDILLSGHRQKIDEWRHEQSLERTKQRRPELFNQNNQE
jgi:tRNA (guanine37-N1)-methyltransferase